MICWYWILEGYPNLKDSNHTILLLHYLVENGSKLVCRNFFGLSSRSLQRYGAFKIVRKYWGYTVMIEERNSFLNLSDTISSTKVPLLSHKDFADLFLLTLVDSSDKWRAYCQHYVSISLCYCPCLIREINVLVKYLKNLKFSSYFSILFLIEK